MQIFMFVINDEPQFKPTLAEAQAVVEDDLINRRGYSGVQWGDDGTDVYHAWLVTEFGFLSNKEPESTWSDQLIWPTEVDASMDRSVRLSPLDAGAAQMSLSVTTRDGKTQITNVIPEDHWNDLRLRPYLITSFAAKSGQSLADHWTKESS